MYRHRMYKQRKKSARTLTKTKQILFAEILIQLNLIAISERESAKNVSLVFMIVKTMIYSAGIRNVLNV